MSDSKHPMNLKRVKKALVSLLTQADVTEALVDIYIKDIQHLLRDLLSYRTGTKVDGRNFCGLVMFTVDPKDCHTVREFVHRVFDIYNIYRDDDSEQLTAMWDKLVHDICEVLKC